MGDGFRACVAIGGHFHWTPRILHDSEGYVRLALGIKQVHHSTPPYIAVHVRHGDFVGWCTVPVKDCFAPLSAIARRVAEVKAELLERRGIAVTHVIMTSDQTDSAWWDAVHSRTVAQHGVRYPTLMDAAIQSGTVGFVGTDRSTVSVIARKRVSSWQGGVVRTVKWGTPGADDHQVKISNAGLSGPLGRGNVPTNLRTIHGLYPEDYRCGGVWAARWLEERTTSVRCELTSLLLYQQSLRGPISRVTIVCLDISRQPNYSTASNQRSHPSESARLNLICERHCIVAEIERLVVISAFFHALPTNTACQQRSRCLEMVSPYDQRTNVTRVSSSSFRARAQKHFAGVQERIPAIRSKPQAGRKNRGIYQVQSLSTSDTKYSSGWMSLEL